MFIIKKYINTMTHTKEIIKNQYGYSITEQKLKHIDEVENGLNCKCFDPTDLNKRLCAKQGKIKAAHFSYHNENGEYNNNGHTYICNESPEHKKCKMDIVKNLRINSNPPILLKRAEPEKHTNIFNNNLLNFVPDIQATTIGNENIFIEIVKTSDISEEKFEKIKRENITTIRIYINDDYKVDDIVYINTFYTEKHTLYSNLYSKSAHNIKELKEQKNELFTSISNAHLRINKADKKAKEGWRKYYSILNDSNEGAETVNKLKDELKQQASKYSKLLNKVNIQNSANKHFKELEAIKRELYTERKNIKVLDNKLYTLERENIKYIEQIEDNENKLANLHNMYKGEVITNANKLKSTLEAYKEKADKFDELENAETIQNETIKRMRKTHIQELMNKDQELIYLRNKVKRLENSLVE